MTERGRTERHSEDDEVEQGAAQDPRPDEPVIDPVEDDE